MFPKTRNLETAFQHVRLFSVVLIAGALGLSAWVVWLSQRAIARVQDRVYILSAGKALEAVAGARAENLGVEARDHIRSFHEDFFTLDPDEKVINANLTRALYLADGSARRQYESLKESGYYSGVISGNISQQINIDSIVLDMHPYPMYFRCYATERIIRPTSLVTRNLVTEGWLRNTGRSDNDPHGFLIEKWNILDNRDLKVERR
ncbi:MAG TPA: conjugative transposon protein TraK [Puia sp.]|jgi:conjugative transposon TraK protein|nr:conjugative transposon protein TraK [Puia sp.]